MAARRALAGCSHALLRRPGSPPALPPLALTPEPHSPPPLRPPYSVKFAQATERRKGQVQEVRQQGGSYGGEATGIKSRLSKSVRL